MKSLSKIASAVVPLLCLLVLAAQFSYSSLTDKELVIKLMQEHNDLYDHVQLLSGKHAALDSLNDEELANLLSELRQNLKSAEYYEAERHPVFWFRAMLASILGAAIYAAVLYHTPKLPAGARLLSPQDKMWSFPDPTNPMFITSLTVTDRSNIEMLRKVIKERIVDKYDRVKYRLVRGGHALSYAPYWLPDPEFSVERHVIPAPGLGVDGKEVTRKELEDFISKVAMEPFSEDRPAWVYYWVDNYEGGRSAFVSHIDHAIADGIALIASTFNMLDPVNPADAVKGQTKVGQAPPSAILALLNLLWFVPYSALRVMLYKADKSALRTSKLSGVRSVAWSNAIPLDDVKKVKNSNKCTVNDVLMSCVAGSFQKFLKEKKQYTDAQLEKNTLRAAVPVNVRSAKQMKNIQLENCFSTLMVDLPLHVIGMKDRLLAMKKTMDQIKRRPIAIANFIALKLVTFIPGQYGKLVMDFLANKGSVVLTNVPGLPYKAKIGDSTTVHFSTFWVPASGQLGLGVSIFSYADEVRLGVAVDHAIHKDPHEFIKYFEDDFANYLKSS